MDVKSVFLNGDLMEEVYVQQPPRFVVKGGSGKVLKLKKALYGLREARRAWNAKLDSELVKLGFVRNPLEHVVYRILGQDGLLLVAVYVDFLIITCTSKASIESFKKEMMSSFSTSVLTPFLETYPGSVECRSARKGNSDWSAGELPIRMVADEEIAECG